MASNYNLLMQVLSKWPVEKTRGSRCYGFHLRQLAKNGFPSGNIFTGDERQNKLQYQSLLRLTSNKYAKEIPYTKPHGASGLNLKDIKTRLSDEYISKHSLWFE